MLTKYIYLFFKCTILVPFWHLHPSWPYPYRLYSIHCVNISHIYIQWQRQNLIFISSGKEAKTQTHLTNIWNLETSWSDQNSMPIALNTKLSELQEKDFNYLHFTIHNNSLFHCPYLDFVNVLKLILLYATHINNNHPSVPPPHIFSSKASLFTSIIMSLLCFLSTNLARTSKTKLISASFKCLEQKSGSRKVWLTAGIFTLTPAMKQI